MLKRIIFAFTMISLATASQASGFFSRQDAATSQPVIQKSDSNQSGSFADWQKQYKKESDSALKDRLIDPKSYGL